MAVRSDRELFSSFADDIYHLADILHARNFAHFESHSELVLDSAYEVDVLNAVPVFSFTEIESSPKTSLKTSLSREMISFLFILLFSFIIIRILLRFL